MNYFTGKNGAYLIAEIGGNHEGDFEYAMRLTALAAQCEVDAVKFQIYTGDSLVNPLQDPERHRHFKRFELSKNQYVELAELCQSYNTAFMASVWDPSAFEYIDDYIQIYKVGTGDLTAYNLIRRVAETKKPIILSTGLADLQEVLDAVSFVENLDESYIAEKKLALLQCTAMYPIPDEDAHLNVMAVLRERTGLPTGYSDHTVGMDAVEVAACMGAEIIEMHFTDSREGKVFRDHKVSATKDELRTFIEKIKKIKNLQGSYDKHLTETERKAKHDISFRRAVYPARDINAGTIIKEESLVTLRPLSGIGAEDFYKVVGKKAKVDLAQYQVLGWEMFD
jgi:N-acetylneuraminate synthase/N,N'-diacetyllegionaminate synthase